MLVRLGLGAAVEPEDLEEFEQLARSAGALPVATASPDVAIGPIRAISSAAAKRQKSPSTARAQQADVILVDHALSPSQERNLEQLSGLRVLDRSGLILDIFAQRARSFEGKLEVELAQLKHLASRLVRGWTHLERQKGGIGLRGPGETQLETDRRLLAARVRSLTRRLERLKQQRETGRSARAEIPVPAVALVGYTNAGKSTLFRALTGSDVYIADQLFATLDPTVRRLHLPGGAVVVLADTVGFIRELPHELIAAFQSTLQEARGAHLLLHVVDASDPRRDEHIEQVDKVLREIGAGDIPQLRVYNKIDRIGVEPAARARCAGPGRRRLDRGRSGHRVWSCCAMRSPSAWRCRCSGCGCICRRARAHCGPGCTPPAWCATSARSRMARSSCWWTLPAPELISWAALPGRAPARGAATTGPQCRLCRSRALPRIATAGCDGALLTARSTGQQTPAPRYGMESTRRRQEAPAAARCAG